MVTIYGTEICPPCLVAEKRLIAADIPHTKVDLSKDPDKLAELKERLGTTTLQTPVIEFEGDLFTIADLPAIIRTAG